MFACGFLKRSRQSNSTTWLSNLVKVAQRGVTVAEELQQAEEGSLVETLQARTLASEVALAAEKAEVAYRGAWRDLAAVTGLTVAVPTQLSHDLAVPLESPDWELTCSEILGQSPELAMAAPSFAKSKLCCVVNERNRFPT